MLFCSEILSKHLRRASLQSDKWMARIGGLMIWSFMIHLHACRKDPCSRRRIAQERIRGCNDSARRPHRSTDAVQVLLVRLDLDFEQCTGYYCRQGCPCFLLSFGFLVYMLITVKLYIIRKSPVNNNTLKVRQVMNTG